MSNNNNMREQFPGIAKADSLLNAAITLGYILLVGLLILQASLGWAQTFLSKDKCSNNVDMHYALKLTGWIMILNIVGVGLQILTYVPNEPVNVVFAFAFVGTILWTVIGLILRMAAAVGGK